MAMCGGGGSVGGRRTRGGPKGGRNFGARDYRKDGGGGAPQEAFSCSVIQAGPPIVVGVAH